MTNHHVGLTRFISNMIDLPEVPQALAGVHIKNRVYGDTVSLESPGYEEGMALCNNMNGSGRVYDLLARPPLSLTETEVSLTVFLPEGIFSHRPYNSVPGDKTLRNIAGVDIITFSNKTNGVQRAVDELRRVIPPTLPVPLAKNLIRRLTQNVSTMDPEETAEHQKVLRNRRRKVRRFLATARGVSSDIDQVITGDFDDETLLQAPTEADERTSREYVRQLVADARGLDHEDISLTYGAEECLMMVAKLCRSRLRGNATLAMPPHDYSRFMKFAHFLEFQIMPIDLNYQDISRTILPGADLFYLSTPRNPDGNVLSIREIEILIGRLPAEAVFIVDNTSISYEYGSAEYASELWKVMTDSAQTRNVKLVLAGSLSKEEQTPWTRTGFAASTDQHMTAHLRNVEAHIPPNLGRVVSNRMRVVESGRLRDAEREYMRGFYETLRIIENESEERMRIHRPESAIKCDRWPSGYHCVIEFSSDDDADRFNQTVIAHTKALFSVANVKPPMRGNTDSTYIPEGPLDPAVFTRTGMPFMSTNAFRLITTGTIAQLTALADTLGIDRSVTPATYTS